MSTTRKKRITYSERIARRVLERIADGESLRTICTADGMPGRSTVLSWITDDHKGFRARYAAAIEVRMHELESELVEMADGALDLAHGAPGTGEASAKVQARKLAIDARKWLLAKLMPKKYGDRLSAEISGPEGGPIRTEAEYRITPEDEAFLKRAQVARDGLRSDSAGTGS